MRRGQCGETGFEPDACQKRENVGNVNVLARIFELLNGNSDCSFSTHFTDNV